MKLIGQDEIWENIKKGNAIARAWAWFQGALEGLMGLVRAVPKKIVDTLKSLTFQDIITVAGAFGKIGGAFLSIAGDFISWGLTTIWNLLEIIFDVVKPGLMGYVKRTGAALKGILKNPLPFLGNLVNAAKLGLNNFLGNFGAHLKAGLIDWLTGSLEGVYIPKALSLLELGKFALSVLGITWTQIRGKIVKALGPNGEKIMQGLELAFDVIVALVKGGTAAAWELIKEKLNDLKDTVISGIISFVLETVIKKAIPKLVAMFIPGAGFISAIISIYDTIMVFVQKLAKIAQVVGAFVDSIVTIAAGNISAAAKRVESVLAGLLSLAISFLAGFLGLVKVTDKIMGVIQKVRATVDKAIDTAIAWIIGKAKALFAKLFSKDKPDDRTEDQKDKDKLAGIADAEKLITGDKFDEQAVRKQLGPIKSRYRLQTLNLNVDSETETDETIHFSASASKERDGQKKTVQKGKEVGPLQIVRKQLSWEQATLDHFLKDPIWKKYKEPAGDYKSAEIDIRHKVSISDTIVSTDKTISPKTIPQAADLLAGKTVGGTNFAPKDKKSRDGIVTAARGYLQAANNDISNLFLGDARVNRGIGKRFDTGAGGDVEADKQEFVNKWGFKDEEFTITIERKSKKRGTEDVVEVLTPQAPSGRRSRR
jgi:hypothetical protein